MLSDLIIRLHPRKKMPNITVSERTHSTAIWTTRMTKSLRSSCSSTSDPPPSSVITVSELLLEYVSRAPARVWLPLNSTPWVMLKRETFMLPCGLSAAKTRDSTSVAHDLRTELRVQWRCWFMWIFKQKPRGRHNYTLSSSNSPAWHWDQLLLSCVMSATTSPTCHSRIKSHHLRTK